MKKYYSLLKAKAPFIAGITLLAFLASCSSSNQFASSFGKRKYTKGYYFDNVASVKSVTKQTTTNTDNTPVVTNEEKQVETAVQPVASVSKVSVITKPLTTAIKTLTNKLKQDNKTAPVITSNRNNSIPQISAPAPESISSYHHGGDGGGDSHHWGRKCLISLAIFVIAGLLAVATVPVAGGTGIGWLLFAFISYIAAICAIIFLILWLISLGNS